MSLRSSPTQTGPERAAEIEPNCGSGVWFEERNVLWSSFAALTCSGERGRVSHGGVFMSLALLEGPE